MPVICVLAAFFAITFGISITARVQESAYSSGRNAKHPWLYDIATDCKEAADVISVILGIILFCVLLGYAIYNCCYEDGIKPVPARLQCDYCKKIFDTPDKTKSVVMDSLGNRRYICNKCLQTNLVSAEPEHEGNVTISETKETKETKEDGQ